MSVSGYVHVNADGARKRTWDPPELEFQAVVSLLMPVLGTEL